MVAFCFCVVVVFVCFQDVFVALVGVCLFWFACVLLLFMFCVCLGVCGCVGCVLMLVLLCVFFCVCCVFVSCSVLCLCCLCWC